eukprot:270899-Karenia_brevis.AAC.1
MEETMTQMIRRTEASMKDLLRNSRTQEPPRTESLPIPQSLLCCEEYFDVHEDELDVDEHPDHQDLETNEPNETNMMTTLSGGDGEYENEESEVKPTKEGWFNNQLRWWMDRVRGSAQDLMIEVPLNPLTRTHVSEDRRSEDKEEPPQK